MRQNNIKPNTQGKKDEMQLFKRKNNIHYNIPVGEDAKNQYQTVINSIKTIDLRKYGDITLDGNFYDFDNLQTYLMGLLEYYKGISEIYEKANYIARSGDIFEEQCGNCRFSIENKIGEEEKKLLKKLIIFLEDKLFEIENYLIDYYFTT